MHHHLLHGGTINRVSRDATTEIAAARLEQEATVGEFQKLRRSLPKQKKVAKERELPPSFAFASRYSQCVTREELKTGEEAADVEKK